MKWLCQYFLIKYPDIPFNQIYGCFLDIVPVLRGFFGLGTGKIHLDGLDCNGNESTLLECNGNDPGVHDCSHSEDAGVICRSSKLMHQQTHHTSRHSHFFDVIQKSRYTPNF